MLFGFLNKKAQNNTKKFPKITMPSDSPTVKESHNKKASKVLPDNYDELLFEAAQIVVDNDRVTIGFIQRAFRIGFNRAARIMDQMEDLGIVSYEEGTKPRKVLMTEIELEDLLLDIIDKPTKSEPPYLESFERIEYTKPATSLLESTEETGDLTSTSLEENAEILVDTFKTYGINVTLKNADSSLVCSTYTIAPEPGTRVAKIKGLQAELEMAMGGPIMMDIGTEPGALSIRVQNKERATIRLRKLIEDSEFNSSKRVIPICAGVDEKGQNLYIDLTKTPHLLVAGTTGSGKSVFINDLIISILYSCDPNDVKLILIDPKQVELQRYNGVPHLLVPVVSDAGKATSAMHWIQSEMNDRYKKFAEAEVKNIDDYNDRMVNEKLPRIVVVIDEYAEMMYNSSTELESIICSLARMSRAAGIYLVIATQRPNSEVITGQIRANIPARIAFKVINWHESHTIINNSGAEKLLGNGDFLYSPSDSDKIIHAQAPFVSDTEIDKVMSSIKNTI